MKRLLSFHSLIPRSWRIHLFGDRERFGLVPRLDDPDWKQWEKNYLAFYLGTQQTFIGSIVNSAGYRVMRKVDLEGKRVLEMGPGEITHMKYWRGRPAFYHIADINEDMITRSSAVLRNADVPFKTSLLENRSSGRLPFADSSFDIIVSFSCLEHLFPLEEHLAEMSRVLRKGGLLVGLIPCEGGLLWGLGRFFTGRRWFKKNTTIDPDKIICWEHPNFAQQIIHQLDKNYLREFVVLWPLRLPVIDFNLVARFIYRKG